jgi:anaerobic magnesium-protoporphyrin IX monomethyl ester cyclase
MLAHTFRGSSYRSVLGLEAERDVFRRYKALRAAEREYVPDGTEGVAVAAATG